MWGKNATYFAVTFFSHVNFLFLPLTANKFIANGALTGTKKNTCIFSQYVNKKNMQKFVPNNPRLIAAYLFE